MDRRMRWLAAVSVVVLASCGGGGTSGSPDTGGPDGSVTDAPGDPGRDAPPTDLPQDAKDEGPPPDPGGPDVPVADAGEDGPATDLPGPDAAGCAGDGECAGRVADLGPCEVPRCQAGQCGKGPADDEAPCEDGNACTVGDACRAGACRPGTPAACDDDNPCTLDLCEPASGCGHPALEGPCDDGSRCTEGDACATGLCRGSAPDCDDGNPCTADGCDPAQGCTHAPLDGGACDDGSACTQTSACVAGTCKGAVVDCDDKNLCTDDRCDPVDGCRNEPGSASRCDDGSDCTLDDRCDAGTCRGTPRDCDDGDPCTDDTCVDGQGCVHPEGTGPCDDLNACTANDACDAGACRGTPVTCDTPPANECSGNRMLSWSRTGLCTPTGCQYTSQWVTCPAGCADGKCIGDPCVGVDCTAAPGSCFQAPGTCQGGSCSWDFLGAVSCDDGNPCTTGDLCGQGVCAGLPVPCNQPPPDACADDRTLRAFRKQGACSPDTGQCAYAEDRVPCAGGCRDGACQDPLALQEADLLPGGGARLSDGRNGLSGVLPGWSGGDRLQSTNYGMTAGFEP